MNIHVQSPQISLDKMSVLRRLSKKLVTDKRLTATSISQAINNGTPYPEISKFITDQAKDNRSGVTDVIGEEILTEIERLCAI